MEPRIEIRREQLRERMDVLAREIPAGSPLARTLEGLAGRRDGDPEGVLAALRRLELDWPELQAAMEKVDHKESVDRAEGFLADLAEDRSSAPAEIVPVIDQYIASLREVIARSWDGALSRKELDAHVLQLRLCYSRDLDRILQGLLPTAPV